MSRLEELLNSYEERESKMSLFNFNKGKIKRLEGEVSKLKKEVTELENKLARHCVEVERADSYLKSVNPFKYKLHSDIYDSEEDQDIANMIRDVDYSLIKRVEEDDYYLDIFGVVKSMHLALKEMCNNKYEFDRIEAALVALKRRFYEDNEVCK